MIRSKLKLIITDQAFGNTRHEQNVAETVGADFAEYHCRTEDEVLNVVQDAHVILNNFAPMTRRVMKNMALGTIIVRYGVGVDNVDLIAAKELGIRVCNVPDYGIEEVADHACAMTLSLARKLDCYGTGIRNGKWEIENMVNGIRSLHDTTIGLIGLGRIAHAYAERMTIFGCRIIGFDPYVAEHQAHLTKIEPMSCEKVFEKANILSLHVPLTSETRHLLNTTTIARMPKDSIIINCSRGGLVDEKALAEALINGHIFGAGLDVFESEPLPADSPLRKLPNIIMSPHAAFFSSRSVDRLQQLASEEALRGLRGETLRCPIV